MEGANNSTSRFEHFCKIVPSSSSFGELETDFSFTQIIFLGLFLMELLSINEIIKLCDEERYWYNESLFFQAEIHMI